MHTTHRTARRTLATFALLALGGLSLTIACGKSDAAPAPVQAKAATVAANSSVDKDAYTVKITAPADCKTGKECKAQISVKAKAEYHINDKYPIKFKTPDTAPDGVTFTKTTLKKEDGKFAEKEGSMDLAFTASKAGKVSIGGTLSIGFCKDEACLMEKVELAVDVDVK